MACRFATPGAHRSPLPAARTEPARQREMDGRLASAASERRARRLRPSDLGLPQLNHARRQCRTDRQRRIKAEANRYHLYIGLICPWASRTLMARKLKGLDKLISVSVVEPALTDQGWRFGDYPGADRDSLNGATYMHEIYTRADPVYTGRATVPVLWDKAEGTIVNNESADILRIFNAGFGPLADAPIDLYPAALRAGIDALNDEIYPRLNSGSIMASIERALRPRRKPTRRPSPTSSACSTNWTKAWPTAARSSSANA
jgi:hypothetical protein